MVDVCLLMFITFRMLSIMYNMTFKFIIKMGFQFFFCAPCLSLPNSVPTLHPLTPSIPHSPPLTLRASLEMERMTLSVIIYGHKPKTCTTN